jgi:hypothetical protein
VKRKTSRRRKKSAPAPVVEQKGRTAASIAAFLAFLALFVGFAQTLSDLFALNSPPRDGTGGGGGGVDGGSASG